jgi:hypothetical protein
LPCLTGARLQELETIKLALTHNNDASNAMAALLSGLERENRELADRLAAVTRERDAAKHLAVRRADENALRAKNVKLLEKQV